MLMDWTSMTLPVATSFLISASGVVPGWTMVRLFFLMVSMFARFLGEVMMTMRKGLPFMVGPMLMTFILPPLCFSTILSHRAILRSAPSWKPKNFSGGVTVDWASRVEVKADVARRAIRARAKQ